MQIDSAVVVGDTHIGWERSNIEQFEEFIEEEIFRLEPDAFFLNGDLIELWRGSFSSVLVNHGDIFQKLTEVHESGIDIIPIAGNHDWRMIETSREAVTEAPAVWNFRKDYEFESGGEEFIVTHGHEADSVNRSRAQNNALCMTSDDVGELMSDTWDFVTDRPVLGKVMTREPIFNPSTRVAPARDGPLSSRPSLRAFSHVNNPDALAQEENRGRYERIVRILQRMYDRTILGAHTHIQESREGYHNPGSWVGNSSGYLHIKDGEVSNDVY